MEAIQINGVIRTFSQPPAGWKNIVNFRKTTFEERYVFGFRQVVEPTLTEYQRKGTIYFDNLEDNYTYTVIDFTQEEVDRYDQQQLDSDASATKEQKYRDDGMEAYLRLKQYLRRKLDDGTLSPTQFDNIYEPIRRKMVWLNTGDWDIAKAELDSIPTGSLNATLLEVLNTVKGKVDTYVSNNY